MKCAALAPWCFAGCRTLFCLCSCLSTRIDQTHAPRVCLRTCRAGFVSTMPTHETHAGAVAISCQIFFRVLVAAQLHAYVCLGLQASLNSGVVSMETQTGIPAHHEVTSMANGQMSRLLILEYTCFWRSSLGCPFRSQFQRKDCQTSLYKAPAPTLSMMKSGLGP